MKNDFVLYAFKDELLYYLYLFKCVQKNDKNF